MNEPEESWQKLVDAARKTPAPLEIPPPAGFASRVVSLRGAIVDFARTLLWRRWSVLVAFACFAVLVAVFAITRCSTDPRPLIEVPSPDLLGS